MKGATRAVWLMFHDSSNRGKNDRRFMQVVSGSRVAKNCSSPFFLVQFGYVVKADQRPSLECRCRRKMGDVLMLNERSSPFFALILTTSCPAAGLPQGYSLVSFVDRFLPRQDPKSTCLEKSASSRFNVVAKRVV